MRYIFTPENALDLESADAVICYCCGVVSVTLFSSKSISLSFCPACNKRLHWIISPFSLENCLTKKNYYDFSPMNNIIKKHWWDFLTED